MMTISPSSKQRGIPMGIPCVLSRHKLPADGVERYMLADAWAE